MILFLTVSSKRYTSWKTKLKFDRSSSYLYSFIFVLPTFTSPEFTSQNLAIRLHSVVLPLPENPTRAVVFPSGTVILKLLNSSASSYENEIFSIEISALSISVFSPSSITGKFLKLRTLLRFCTATPLIFCILPANSNPEKTTKLITISMIALVTSTFPEKYLISELRIITHIPILNTSRNMNCVGTKIFSTSKNPLRLFVMLSFNSLTVFLSFPNALVIPIPLTYSSIFELKSNLSPNNLSVNRSVFLCVIILTEIPTIKVNNMITAVTKS